ncbi:MAG: (deoxy)nucleoside triphosphate pyrophosphohydrolase [Clostridiales bacterium]|nr:(deoxy)nucleoside triphosphate pyrophosphohydrolase [Clostridiales bacterium]
MKNIEVVAAILVKEDKILATKRGYGEFMNMWEFPGGKIEPGEAKEEALLREIREELNIEISIGDLLCTVDYDYPDFHLTMHCFICTVTDGKITLIEHKDAKWLSMDELDTVQWLPADIGILDKIKRYMSTK